MEETTLGTPSDGNISKKIISARALKLRSVVLELEDLYYIFKDDIEDKIQDIKYQLDKLSEELGELENGE